MIISPFVVPLHDLREGVVVGGCDLLGRRGAAHLVVQQLPQLLVRHGLEAAQLLHAREQLEHIHWGGRLARGVNWKRYLI